MRSIFDGFAPNMPHFRSNKLFVPKAAAATEDAVSGMEAQDQDIRVHYIYSIYTACIYVQAENSERKK